MSAFMNYTTKIAAEKTVGEVQAMLGRSGASAVATTYEGGRASGLNFQMTTAHGLATFALPVDVDGVLAALTKSHQAGRLPGISRDLSRSRDHAERVAWRVVKDWLDAQLALIAANMAQLDTVMLPYLLVDGQTLTDRYLERGGQLMLEGGSS